MLQVVFLSNHERAGVKPVQVIIGFTVYGPSRINPFVLRFLELFPIVIALHIWGPAWPPDVLLFILLTLPLLIS